MQQEVAYGLIWPPIWRQDPVRWQVRLFHIYRQTSLEQACLVPIGGVEAWWIDIERADEFGDAHRVISPLVEQVFCYENARLAVKVAP
ncbi:MAG: hypothetical protein K0S73_2039 [Stenotrophomonas rhizophila]|nr:hypothetical protein [Stenotrophomonas rhizophila]